MTDLRINENPGLPWRYCRRSQPRDNEQSSGDEWEPTRPGNVTQSPKNSDSIADKLILEVQNLRSGYSSLRVEIERLNEEVKKQSQLLAEVEKSGLDNSTCTNVACVLSRLRQKLALKMQMGLKHFVAPPRMRNDDESERTALLTRTEGAVPGILKARVECTLAQFESLALNIKARQRSPGSIYFQPDFSRTQLPLLHSTMFRIFFQTFADLCDHIGVHSTSDRFEMARRCGSGPQGDILRILGTYSVEGGEPKCAARIYVGTSCAMELDDNPHGSRDALGSGLYPVLTRNSREWNTIDSRYASALYLERLPLPCLNDMSAESNAFALIWKRGPEIGSRIWSKSICEPTQICGWLDVCLPFIQASGKFLCTEIGGLASDDVWEELLEKAATAPAC